MRLLRRFSFPLGVWCLFCFGEVSSFLKQTLLQHQRSRGGEWHTSVGAKKNREIIIPPPLRDKSENWDPELHGSIGLQKADHQMMKTVEAERYLAKQERLKGGGWRSRNPAAHGRTSPAIQQNRSALFGGGRRGRSVLASGGGGGEVVPVWNSYRPDYSQQPTFGFRRMILRAVSLLVTWFRLLASPSLLRSLVDCSFRPWRVLVLSGPSGAGKSRLAVRLARRLQEETGMQSAVLSSDAVQVYSGLDVGSDKIGEGDREGVPHCLMDLLRVGEGNFAVSDFRERACEEMSRLLSEGANVVVVGGSSFYLNALLNGGVEGPEEDPKFREQMERRCDKEGVEVLYEELQRRDPEYARGIGKTDKFRIIRALEKLEGGGGKTMGDFRVSSRLRSPNIFERWLYFDPKSGQDVKKAKRKEAKKQQQEQRQKKKNNKLGKQTQRESVKKNLRRFVLRKKEGVRIFLREVYDALAVSSALQMPCLVALPTIESAHRKKSHTDLSCPPSESVRNVAVDFRCWFAVRPREELQERVALRAHEMVFEKGLIEETLRENKGGALERNRSASKALGYRQTLELLRGRAGRGEGSVDVSDAEKRELVEKIRSGTMRLIRQQMTWHKKERRFRWIDLSPSPSSSSVGTEGKKEEGEFKLCEKKEEAAVEAEELIFTDFLSRPWWGLHKESCFHPSAYWYA